MGQKPLIDLETMLLDQIESAIKEGTLVDFVNEYRTVKGKPWKWVSKDVTEHGKETIKDFRYLIPIYLDDHPAIIVKKSRQMALSEYAVNWIMGKIVKIPYTTALHVFPNQDQAKKFSTIRLSPLFNRKDSPKLAAMLANPEEHYKQSALQAALNVYHKQFINGSNYVLSFVGGENTKSTDARSVSADIIVLDEAKDLPEDKIADVLECMSLSSIRQMRMIGTPDFEGTVFDMRFNQSDRHEWIVECPECGAKQQLSMDTIRETKYSPHEDIAARDTLYYYACQDCQAELDRTADYGEWIPQNPGAIERGYHVTQLMASWISADEIMQKKSANAKYPNKFVNEVLGEVYQGGSKPLTFNKLLRCSTDGNALNTKFRFVSMGVDWGNQSHYIILGSNDHESTYIIDFGIMEHHLVETHAHKVIELMDLWGVDLAVLDSGYGKAQNQHVFQNVGNKAYGCFYRDSAFNPKWETIDTITDPKYGKTFLMPNEFQYHVYTDHTGMCDNAHSSVESGELKIPVDEDDELVPGISPTRDMLDNMCMARTVVTDTGDKRKRKWVITKAHYFAALCYAKLALDNVRNNKIHGTGASDFFAPIGFK